MSFYLLNLVNAFLCIGIYIGFRTGVDSYLRHKKHSKTFIRKSKKGFMNYWFYMQLNAEAGLGYVYYLNLIYIVLGALYFVISVAFGWLEVFKLPIAILNLALCSVVLPASVFADVYDNYEYHGQPFILLKRNMYGKGYSSSVFSFVWIACVAAFSVYIFSLALR